MEKKKKIIVNIFGKPGCGKCAMLNRRVDKLLEKPEYAGFTKQYNDLMTEDGLVKFCFAQCLNPSRVPAMLISTMDENGKEEFAPNLHPDEKDEVCGFSKLYQYLGVQTDYSDEGKGIISPEMIESIFKEAAAL